MKMKSKRNRYLQTLLVVLVLTVPLSGQKIQKQQKSQKRQQQASPNTNLLIIPVTPSFVNLEPNLKQQLGYFLDIAGHVEDINKIDRFKPYNWIIRAAITKLFSKASSVETDPCAKKYLIHMGRKVSENSFYSSEPDWFNLEKNQAEILVLQNKKTLLKKIMVNRIFPLANNWLNRARKNPETLLERIDELQKKSGERSQAPPLQGRQKPKLLDTFVFTNNIKETHKYKEYSKRFIKIRNNLPYKKKLSVSYDAFTPHFKIADLFYSNAVQGPSLIYPDPESFFLRDAGKFKIIIFKNIVEAYRDCVLLQISERVLLNLSGRPVVTIDAYISNIVMNRISHHMGHMFELVVQNNQIKKIEQDTKVDLDARKQEEKRKPKAKITRELKLVSKMMPASFRIVEEVKAHALALHNTSVLLEEGLISKDEEINIYSTYIVTLFDRLRRNRGKRFNSAHVVLFNYLLRNGALIFDLNTRKLSVHPGQFPLVAEKLSTFMVNNFRYFSNMMKTYGYPSSEMMELLEKLNDVPMRYKTEFKLDKKEYNGKISN